MHPTDISPASTRRSLGRQAGDELVVAQAQRQVQTFFDELKNRTSNYRTVASLDAQIAQEYRGRCILELLQNAHDALAHVAPDDPRQISFLLSTDPDPVLSVGNSGRPFRKEDFDGICQLAQSPKDPNESVGNKGLGFRSVLEVSSCPEIWSVAPTGSDPSFVFRFDPNVADQVATAARELAHRGTSARSPFDPAQPLVDWSTEHLRAYQAHVSHAGVDVVCAATNFLSPYLFPLPIHRIPPPDVDGLLRAGHATVIRLPLNGGTAGTPAEAVRSVTDQLRKLDARSTLFLHYLRTLLIDINGDRHVLERTIDSDHPTEGHTRTRHHRVCLTNSRLTSDAAVSAQFHLWTRRLGGDDQPEDTQRITQVVQHLPNRWPEVRQVSVGIAVQDAPAADEGVFVIFLPTEMTTGTGAHINAPFYGSLDRRQINFDEPYNELLLQYVLDLCLDTVAELVAQDPADWRAQAVVDLLSSTATVSGDHWRLTEDLQQRASLRDQSLRDLALVLCDGGWRVPASARMMPDVPDDDPIGAQRWRAHARFDVVSTVLAGRAVAVETLLTCLDGSPSPLRQEWRDTIERLATQLQTAHLDVTWNAFLNSVISVLPADLRTQPKSHGSDPLLGARFLPTQDGGLVNADPNSPALFFQPVRGIDDAADLVREVPASLHDRIAFLHPDVRTHEQEGSRRRNTPVQKFLDGRFARGFRREDILRDVVVPALPPLPVSHGTAGADRCSEIFAWTLRLLGNDEWDTLLPFVRHLPVACDGGWLAMDDAVFGPGWPGRLGDLVRSLATELPNRTATRLRTTALLPPDDPRWRVSVADRGELLARAGVADGLRLRHVPNIHFCMQGSGFHQLPNEPPMGVPQDAWDAWREAVRAQARPAYDGLFDYELTEVNLLPEIHHLTRLTASGRDALSRLLLASLTHWPPGWDSVAINKTTGYGWSARITSPLKHWLRTLPWLRDRITLEQPLHRRWMVPESYLRGQRERYSHLDPLSLDLTRRLSNDPQLKDALMALGLNVYPTEDDRTGPALLDALAAAWTAGRVPPGRFDVFLGQLRDAWKHLDPDKGLPHTFLVRTGRRQFSAHDGDELADIYLPDDRDRTRSLHEHGRHTLEMLPLDGRGKADALSAATNIKRASTLDERFLVEGAPWARLVDGIPLLQDTVYAAWLPVTLLTIAAYGGPNPTGATTARWHNAAGKLRRAHLLECQEIAVELVDDEQVVASSAPDAQWLPGDVLAIRYDKKLNYGCLASAAQAMLERQDLLKDLRLVLDTLTSLASRETPTPDQVEAALERAEVDAQAIAYVRNYWSGANSFVADRIRPVLVLLRIPGEELDAAATDIDRLTEWLSSNVRQWAATDLLASARRSRDDRGMGEAAWRALGDVAQLPSWNEALGALGDRYVTVENREAEEQTAAHLEAAAPLLRGFARHVALEVGDPNLFHEMEAVRQAFGSDDAWSTRWWQVPFEAVIDGLCSSYREGPGAAVDLDVLRNAVTVEDLYAVFQRRNIEVDPDPYETARLNRNKLEDALFRVHDLRRAWLELRDSEAVVPEPPELPADLGPLAYLQHWSDAEVLGRALHIIADAHFISACTACASLCEVRERLGLDAKVIDAHRRERVRREQEAARKRRTFDVAGVPFEVGGTASYGELFDRLDGLAEPDGPRASKDRFTPLAEAVSSDRTGRRAGKGAKTSRFRPSADLRELVGVVGEIHAYRFLRAEFGRDVTRDAWVSEIRLRVLPLVPGEGDDTSDGHGFDFRFRYNRQTWCVEVKATSADDTQFDLGSSEISAAARLARKRGWRWRVLRVRNALSQRPEFDWLPNPFEGAFRKHFRLHKGGMRVSYAHKRKTR